MKKWILIIGLIILVAGIFYFRTGILKMVKWNETEESPTTEFKGPTGPPSVKGPGGPPPGQ